MQFEERLRAYLEAVARGEAREPPRLRVVDEHALRRHLVARLAAHPRASEHPGDIARWHSDWVARLPDLQAFVERLPPDVPTDPNSGLMVACELIDEALLVQAEQPLIERLERGRRFSEFLTAPDIARYAVENNLVRELPGTAVSLTSLGRTLLGLRGRDAVRWLLTIETSLNTGPNDRWRMPRDLLAELVDWDGIDIVDLWHADDPPYSIEAVHRAVAFELLHRPADASATLRIRTHWHEVIQAVLNPGPWHSAIQAMLHDERAFAVRGMADAATATEATIEQSRMMAHEVRNALVPVRYHLDALASTDALHASRIEAARRGVVRVLDFVDQLVVTADLITEPARRCDLVELLTIACLRLDGRERIEIDEPTSAYLIAVPPQRFVVALTNILQNALQFAPPASSIRVSWHDSGDGLHMHIDDGGPGVPPADRARIFDDGYTTRPGGSGFGLAYVRKVVESSLRGRVWCEESDLGGARFVIAIPGKTP